MIVGNGAREDVISHAYRNSPQVERVIVTPGNDFLKEFIKRSNIYS